MMHNLKGDISWGLYFKGNIWQFCSTTIQISEFPIFIALIEESNCINFFVLIYCSPKIVEGCLRTL